MTEPFHNEDERQQLHQLLAESRAHTRELERRTAQSRARTQRIEEMIAETEGTSSEELVQRRRRGVFLVPGLAGGLVLARNARKAVNPRRVAKGVTTVAVAAGAFALGAYVRPQPHHDGLPPPAVALPPAGHTPPLTGPPRSGPPAPPSTPPSPRRAAPVAGPPAAGETTPPSSQPSGPPPATTPPEDPPPVGDPEDPTSPTHCRINLPKLGICLLRGHWVR